MKKKETKIRNDTKGPIWLEKTNHVSGLPWEKQIMKSEDSGTRAHRAS